MFKKIGKFFIRLFDKLFPEPPNSPDPVTVMEKITLILFRIVENPKADIVVELTATQWDNHILAIIRDAIRKEYVRRFGQNPPHLGFKTHSEKDSYVYAYADFLRELGPNRQQEYITNLALQVHKQLTANHASR